MAVTPVGAFVPVLLTDGLKGKYGLAGRLGIFSPKTGDGNNSIGATGLMEVGQNAVASATLGYTMVGCPSGSTCDNGLLLGGDLASSLWKSAGNGPNTMQVQFHGSLGWSSFGDNSFASAVANFPLVWVMNRGGSARNVAVQGGAAGSSRITLWAAPGFGWGRMSFDSGTISGNESGTRPMYSLGGEWMGANGIGIHAGFSRIVIEDAGNTIGLGVTYQLK